MPRKRFDITGKTFGRWLAAEHIGGKYWRCVCECGVQHEVRSDTLLSGISKSCGCLIAEKVAVRMTKHGHSSIKKLGKNTPEYNAWISAKTRCFNPNDPNKWRRYGGRGITMSSLWVNDFQAFLAYIGKRPSDGHSLDRYPDNDGNYEPGNVRWATAIEQANNRSTNKKVA